MTRRVSVSDHAICRYMERVHGWNVGGLKAQIAERVRAAASSGASSVIIDGLSYTIAHNADGSSVVTTVKPPRTHVQPVKAFAAKREGRK